MALSDPDRDRKLASRPRERWRFADGLDREIDAFRRSPEFAAMRRFARIHSALLEILPKHAHGKVKALNLRAGVLALEVSDGVLLAELRSTCARQILTGLAAARTGATRLVWRVAQRP